jgi:Ni,Fe-hydrogenase maturation factor
LKVLVFGNPLVRKDSIAMRMLPALRKKFPQIEFREADTAENLESEGRDLLILDSAESIDRVTLLEGLEHLEMPKAYSMHDFDLPITLKLLKKLGKLDSVRIIAVPHGYPLRKAVAEASALISSLLSKSA